MPACWGDAPALKVQSVLKDHRGLPALQVYKVLRAHQGLPALRVLPALQVLECRKNRETLRRLTVI